MVGRILQFCEINESVPIVTQFPTSNDEVLSQEVVNLDVANTDKTFVILNRFTSSICTY